MLRRIVTCIVVLLFIPVVINYPPITIDAEIPAEMVSGRQYDYIIRVKNADTLAYSFWWATGSDSYVRRTDERLIKSAKEIVGKFGTCAITNRPQFGAYCKPDWVLGNWQLRVLAWKWYGRYKLTSTRIFSFVIRQ
jgi:hypothetical protein